jgi:hypothetical protein
MVRRVKRADDSVGCVSAESAKPTVVIPAAPLGASRDPFRAAGHPETSAIEKQLTALLP